MVREELAARRETVVRRAAAPFPPPARRARMGGMAVHASITPYLSAGDRCRPVFFAGPCVIESRAHALKMAKAIKTVFADLGVADRLVFKSSFDKANRSAGDSFRGPGIEKGLDILSAVKGKLDLPILTDVHEVEQCELAAEVADVLQVPAFLCRQTDLIVAAAKTGRAVNVKKGQFLAPDDCSQIVAKCRGAGNPNVLLTERGTTFGYHNLVVDFRGLPMMRALGAPVIYDATHSMQLPGGLGKETGGSRQYAPALARAAAAVGVDGYFFEVHDDPANAKSDRATQLPLAELETFLSQLLKFDALRREMEG
jgi:2-dehydro-3-deoxyphosphooctonate aldolase (KDO 8-P synthase)